MHVHGTPASQASAIPPVTVIAEAVWTQTNIGLCCVAVILTAALLVILARWTARAFEILRVTWLARNLRLPHELNAINPSDASRPRRQSETEPSMCRLGCARCAFRMARWETIRKAAVAARTDVDTFYMMEQDEKPALCDCAMSTPGTSPDLQLRTPELESDGKMVAIRKH